MINQALSLFLLLNSFGVIAQSSRHLEEATADLDQERRGAQSVVPQFRESIEAMLSPSQKKIEESTSISITDNAQIRAWATRENGRRVIRMDAGLAQVLDWISTSVAAITPRYPNCSHHFVIDLFASIHENSKMASVGETPNAVPAPFTYAQLHPEYCRGVTPVLITGNPQAQQMRLIALGSSMHWVLSHELAHQLYGHVDVEFRDPMTAKDLQRSRDNELQADKFAFRALSQPGFDPVGAMPAYLFIGIMDADAENENTSDHPSGERRFMILLQALEADMNDPQWSTQIKADGQWDKFLAAMGQLRTFVGDVH